MRGATVFAGPDGDERSGWNGSILPMRSIGKMPVHKILQFALKNDNSVPNGGKAWVSCRNHAGGNRCGCWWRVDAIPPDAGTRWANPCPPMAGVALETESLGSDLQKRQNGRTAVMPRIQLAVEGILRSIADASPIWDRSAVLSAITGSTKRDDATVKSASSSRRPRRKIQLPRL